MSVPLKATNPLTNKTVSAEQFLREVGPNYKEKNIIPFCPCCKKPMKLYGVLSKVRGLTFKHVTDSGYCLLSLTRNNPFYHLKTSHIDFSAGEQLKKEFCNEQNIKEAYAVALKLCNNRLSTNEFIKLCTTANKLNLWSLSKMDLQTVPYLLVTLNIFKEEDKSIKNNRNYTYKLKLIKPGGTIDILWDKPSECYLEKLFENGEQVKQPPDMNPVVYSLYDRIFEDQRENIDWMGDFILKKLQSFC